MQTRLTLEVVPPTSTSADCTRERLRLMLKLKPTPLATMAFPWPTTPATPTGLESELLDSPPPAMVAVVREALTCQWPPSPESLPPCSPASPLPPPPCAHSHG